MVVRLAITPLGARDATGGDVAHCAASERWLHFPFVLLSPLDAVCVGLENARPIDELLDSVI